MTEQQFLPSEAARMLGIAKESVIWYEQKGVVTLRRIGRIRVLTLADIEKIRKHRLSHGPGRPPKPKPLPQ
jgi:hypothetical protein